jgi:hypothetical protein
MLGIALRDIVIGAVILVAAITLGLALAKPEGRDALALMGLRVADALVKLLEGRLSATSKSIRNTAKRDALYGRQARG